MATSPSSTQANWNPWTSFVEVSPARISARLESKPDSSIQPARQLAAAFGLSMPVWFGDLDLAGCSLRTSQGSLFQTQCEELSENWPDSGMWDATAVYELQSSVPVISESASSSWPTPNVSDANGAKDFPPNGRRIQRTGSDFGMGLKDAANTWPTPSVPNGGRTTSTSNYGPQGEKRQIDLGAIAAMWATPTEDNANNAGGPSRLNGTYRDLTVDAIHWRTPTHCSENSLRGSGQDPAIRAEQGHAINLQDQTSVWQTPGTDSFRSRGGDRKDEMGLDQQARFFPTSLPALQIPDGQPSSESVQTSRRRLNPRFVEWLMGFPIGWTEL